jgi:Zn-dependent peptidase ImmA (M78 family)
MARRAESAAQRVLSEHGVEEAPVPVDDIAHQLGVVITHVPFEGDISGMLFRAGTKPVIGVNARQSRVRQRFTVAHELGHLQLHPGHDVHVDRDIKVNFRDEASGRATHVDEIEANAFAAELLMPHRLIHRELLAGIANGVPDDQLVTTLANRFDVSNQAMQFRLINLGILQMGQIS